MFLNLFSWVHSNTTARKSLFWWHFLLSTMRLKHSCAIGRNVQAPSPVVPDRNATLGLQTPGEEVFGPQKHTIQTPSQEVFGRLGQPKNLDLFIALVRLSGSYIHEIQMLSLKEEKIASLN